MSRTLPLPYSRLCQVTEEEYAALVNKRRQEYGGFIVGEDGDECVPSLYPFSPRPIDSL